MLEEPVVVETCHEQFVCFSPRKKNALHNNEIRVGDAVREPRTSKQQAVGVHNSLRKGAVSKVVISRAEKSSNSGVQRLKSTIKCMSFKRAENGLQSVLQGHFFWYDRLQCGTLPVDQLWRALNNACLQENVEINGTEHEFRCLLRDFRGRDPGEEHINYTKLEDWCGGRNLTHKKKNIARRLSIGLLSMDQFGNMEMDRSGIINRKLQRACSKESNPYDRAIYNRAAKGLEEELASMGFKLKEEEVLKVLRHFESKDSNGDRVPLSNWPGLVVGGLDPNELGLIESITARYLTKLAEQNTICHSHWPSKNIMNLLNEAEKAPQQQQQKQQKQQQKQQQRQQQRQQQSKQHMQYQQHNQKQTHKQTQQEQYPRPDRTTTQGWMKQHTVQAFPTPSAQPSSSKPTPTVEVHINHTPSKTKMVPGRRGSVEAHQQFRPTPPEKENSRPFSPIKPKRRVHYDPSSSSVSRSSRQR